MDQEVKSEQDFAYLVTLLTKENKRYVVAVADALLYTQSCRKSEPQPLSKCSS